MIQDPEGIELRQLLQAADFKGRDVLEVGCGDGRVTSKLASVARSLIAIDPDEARLSRARAALPYVDFRQGTGEDLEFPDLSFDIVAYTFSLHHQDAGVSLAEATRVLRHGGLVVAVEPGLEGDMHRLFNLFREEDEQISGAMRALRSCGLDLVGEREFEIENLFDSMDDLYEYFFGNYGRARDGELMSRMTGIVGARASGRPIRLMENANITVLRKV